MSKQKKAKLPKLRNPYALAARCRHFQVFHHRTEPQGGSKREDFFEGYDDDEGKSNMNKINKEKLEKYNELLKKIKEATQDLDEAVNDFNVEIEMAFDETVMPRLDDLNNLRQELSEFFEGIAEEAQNYFDDRSESWQEDEEKGGNYSAWIEWFTNNANDLTDKIELEFPEMETPDIDNGDIEEMPESPEDI